MNITKANEIIEDIKALKLKMVKAQDYSSAARMRDIEKEYLKKQVK